MAAAGVVSSVMGAHPPLVLWRCWSTSGPEPTHGLPAYPPDAPAMIVTSAPGFTLVSRSLKARMLSGPTNTFT